MAVSPTFSGRAVLLTPTTAAVPLPAGAWAMLATLPLLVLSLRRRRVAR